MTLKGTKTANNLMHAFAGEVKLVIVILIMLQSQKKKDLYKFKIFS